jgi:hypothetical protein
MESVVATNSVYAHNSKGYMACIPSPHAILIHGIFFNGKKQTHLFLWIEVEGHAKSTGEEKICSAGGSYLATGYSIFMDTGPCKIVR